MSETIFDFLPGPANDSFRRYRQQVSTNVWRSSQDAPPPAQEQRLQLKAEPYLEIARTASDMCHQLLQFLSPRAAVAAWRSVRAPTLASVNGAGLIDRFRWVLGAKATGPSQDLALLTEFFEQAGCWWAASYVADCLRRPASEEVDLALSVDAMPGREFLARTTSVTIRYHWASHLIATEIARQVCADASFADPLPEFTVANVNGLRIAARGYLNGTCHINPSDSRGMALATLMAVKAGELADLRFEDAMTSRRCVTQPWIRFGDGLAPCAAKEIMFSLERSMIAAVDGGLAGNRENKVTKGELFERTVQQCVLRSIVAGRRDIRRPSEIKLNSTEKKARDIDFVVIESAVELIGEAKAMEVPDPRFTASTTFEEQVGTVYEQLDKRLKALDSGMPLVDGDGNRYYGAPDVVGIGATLHPYSSSLGDPRMLPFANRSADTSRIAVADLHSWILILSAIHDLGDLRNYLSFRDQLRQIEAWSVDESDTALAYFSPRRNTEFERCRDLYSRRDLKRHFAMTVPPCTVDTLTALNRERPKDCDEWRRTFLQDCRTVNFL